MADGPDKYADQLLSVVNDAARTVSSRFVTFLTVGLYVGVTIASTTDEMLVRGILVTLPLLNTPIPISGLFGFYTIAPWLIVVLHSDLLLQLSALGSKLNRLEGVLGGLNDDDSRLRVRERLANFHYVQFLARRAPSRVLHLVSGLTMCASMIVLPLGLLCWTLLRFLPLHDPGVTSSQRLAVYADVLLVLGFLWPLSMQGTIEARGAIGRLLSLRSVVVAVCVGALVLGVTAAVPEAQRPGTLWFGLRNLNLSEKVLTANSLSPDVVNALRDGDITDRERQLRNISPLNCLQGRDLRYAKFFNAILPRLDLRSRRVGDGQERILDTRLDGADFRWAQMQQVLLDDADLHHAQLQGAQLQGSSLARAKLVDADLSLAQLQDAKLGGADLSRALAKEAQCQGADFSEAVLQETSFEGAQLQGATLRGANLRKANLSGAALQGADLSGADLEGANLQGAHLQGALMLGSIIAGADFENAEIALADFRSARRGWGGPNSRPDTLDRAKGGHCLAQDPEVITPCAAPEDGPQYRTNLLEYLASLGCADAYVARGLSAQALSSPDPDRRMLAGVLLAHGPQPKCRGVQLLPEGLKGALERQVEMLAAARKGADI